MNKPTKFVIGLVSILVVIPLITIGALAAYAAFGFAVGWSLSRDLIDSIYSKAK